MTDKVLIGPAGRGVLLRYDGGRVICCQPGEIMAVIETAIYVNDLKAAETFYRDILAGSPR